MIGTDTNKQPKLSACMMVKNEERCLERCLSSLIQFVDEIIIVDTGSEDATIEIAEKFGAKIYHHPWENDFSKHRNQSLSYASGDWILIVDADEELDFENSSPEEVRRQFNFVSTRHEALAVSVKDMQKGRVVMQFHSSRLFKNGVVHYEGMVHNQPMMDKDGVRAALFPILTIKHCGYDLDPNQKAKKAKRTSSLLFNRLKKDPTDYSAYFYLAEVFAEVRDDRGCVKYGEEYFKYKDELGYKFNTSLYYTVVHAYMRLKNFKRAGEVLKMAIQDRPDDIDIAFCTVEYGKRVNSSHLIVSGARKYVKLYEEFKRNPILRGNNFTFTINNEVYSVCLLELFKYQKFLADQTYGTLNEIVKDVTPEFAEKIRRDLKQIMGGV